jgi:hypothetical protein
MLLRAHRLDAVRNAQIEKAPVRLDTFSLFEDLRHDWIRRPILSLNEATGRLASTDVADDREVGRLFRRRVSSVVNRGEAVQEILEFLLHFESNLLDELIVPAARRSLEAVVHLITAYTAEGDSSARKGAEAFAQLWKRVTDEDEIVLKAIPHMDSSEVGIEMPTGSEQIKTLFSDDLDVDEEMYARGEAQLAKELRAAGHDLKEIGAHQLGYLVSPGRIPTGFEGTFVGLAFRLGLSHFPLLAHRAAYLTWKLLARAAANDSAGTNELIGGFYRAEAAWIIASAPRYEQAMARYCLNDELPAIVEAYQRLAEGVLRPYGSLLVALDDLARKRPTLEPLVASTVGGLEQRFGNRAEAVIELLRLFVRRELRNADAHARTAVGGRGELIVRDENGRAVTVVADHVFGATAGLRSALDGIDVAANLFFCAYVVPTTSRDGPYSGFISEEMLAAMALLAAVEYTDGTITDIHAREGLLRLTFVGEATEAGLDGMLRHIANASHAAFDELQAIDEEGSLIYRLTLFDP